MSPPQTQKAKAQPLTRPATLNAIQRYEQKTTRKTVIFYKERDKALLDKLATEVGKDYSRLVVSLLYQHFNLDNPMDDHHAI